jgi:hypothetical protein
MPFDFFDDLGFIMPFALLLDFVSGNLSFTDVGAVTGAVTGAVIGAATGAATGAVVVVIPAKIGILKSMPASTISTQLPLTNISI